MAVFCLSALTYLIYFTVLLSEVSAQKPVCTQTIASEDSLETAASSPGPGEVLCLREEYTETADRISKVTAAGTSVQRTKVGPYPCEAAMLKDLI